MARTNPRYTRRWSNIASLALTAIIVATTLAACGGTSGVDPTATTTPAPIPTIPAPTATLTPAPPTATESVSAPETTEPEPTETSVSIDPDALAAEVEALVGEIEGLVEVVVALPDGTTLTEINSYEPIEAASLYKLAIMVELYVEREMGELSFDEEIVLDPAYFSEEDSVFGEADIGYSVSIETLLQSMITLSSNVAATALLARVGNENVNLTMASLGLVATEIRWSPGISPDAPSSDEEESVEEEPETEEPTEEPAVEEEPTEEEGSNPLHRRLLLDPRADAALNVTTAADIAALYVMLVNGQIISESVSQEMLLLLQDQQINDRLPAYLPEDTVVAHKTGNLDGLVHDAGVIFAPTGPIVVVVLTEDVEEWQAIDLIATVARLAYDTSP